MVVVITDSHSADTSNVILQPQLQLLRLLRRRACCVGRQLAPFGRASNPSRLSRILVSLPRDLLTQCWNRFGLAKNLSLCLEILDGPSAGVNSFSIQSNHSLIVTQTGVYFHLSILLLLMLDTYHFLLIYLFLR